MSNHLTPEREAEIAARVERYAKGTYERLNPGFRWEDAQADDRATYTEPSKAAIAVADEELAEVRAENALLQRKVASLKELQAKDDAEYAEAIAERDRARTALREACDQIAALESDLADAVAARQVAGEVTS